MWHSLTNHIECNLVPMSLYSAIRGFVHISFSEYLEENNLLTIAQSGFRR